MLIATISALRHVAEEHEQDHRHQHHAQEEVLPHRVGGDVDQVGAVVVRLDENARQHLARRGVVQLRHFLLHVVEGGQRVVALVEQHDALHLVLFVAPDELARPVHHPMNAGGRARFLRLAHLNPAQARLAADHHAPLAGALAVGQPAAIDQVFQENVPVVDRRDDDVADLQNALILFLAQFGGGGGRQPPALEFLQLVHVRPFRFLRLLQRLGRLGVGVPHAQHLVHRVLAAAEQADAAHRHGDVALDHHVGADVLVGVLQGRLQLGQGDAELLEAFRVGINLVALDGAAVAGHIDDAGHAAELALQHPVLQLLEVVEGVDVAALGVLGAVEGVAVDLARRRFGRNGRRHTGGERLELRRQPVDDFLAGLLVFVAVVELQAHERQAEQRLGADVGEVGHPGHGHFHRHGDQALDLLGGGAGVQRVDLDDGRRGSG